MPQSVRLLLPSHWEGKKNETQERLLIPTLDLSVLWILWHRPSQRGGEAAIWWAQPAVCISKKAHQSAMIHFCCWCLNVFVAYVRKVCIESTIFQNFDSEELTVATSCQQGRSAPDIYSSITLRLFSQLESFISDVFIFLPIYWTTSSISLTPHKPYPSVTRQTNWQCCQNRIK